MEPKKKIEKMCDYPGCNNIAERSIPKQKASKALGISFDRDGRRVHLCKEHYKEYKKATKKERELNRLGW